MGNNESCRGNRVGETYEFVANSEICHVTPVVNESKLVYSSNIFGKAGMKNSIINRFEFMVSKKIKMRRRCHNLY